MLGDVAAVLVLVGFVFPLAFVFQAASATPFVVIAVRHRLRAVLAGAVAGGTVSFLVAGAGPAASVAGAAAVGFVVGQGIRRRWDLPSTVAFGMAAVWAPLSAIGVGVLAVLPVLRELSLEQIRITWRGMRRTIFAGLPPESLEQLDEQFEWIIANWYISLPAGAAFVFLIAILLGRAIAKPAVERVRLSLAPPSAPLEPATGDPGPVPAKLDRVSFRYPGASRYALHEVTVSIPAAAFVAVLGPNGSGKSTLARVLSGAAPASGSIQRPGDAGLGREGGTAIVFQRPETQVVGIRVRDDVVWGLPGEVDVDEFLGLVGLAGFADRETATLSGGELQRLALASALARRPALLLSDESTSMLDRRGSAELMRVLSRLPAERGVTVVHVTHRAEEARGADLVLVLSEGRLVECRAVAG